MKRKKTTAAELPEEVVRNEILTRLPIKSVVRFKCVAKSWLSLFSDPQFVKEHHTRTATQNPNDYDCLVADKRTRIAILSRYKETILLPSDRRYLLIGSVNGLICLRRDMNFGLWNPAIHQFKKFSFPRNCSCSYEFDAGLGFDCVGDNFKVVVLSADLRSATVYWSGSDSWSNVVIPDNVFRKSGVWKSTPIVIVKSCPYWICSSYANDKHERFISLSAVKFNVETNEFKLSPEFQFDASVHGGTYKFHYKFVDMKDCLTLMVNDRNSSNCVLDIYSLDEEEEGFGSWCKMYTIGPLNFHTRGSFVKFSQGFKYGGEIVFYNNGMFSCYDHRTDTIKCLHGTTFAPYLISCFSYTPTLFYIQGMKSVYLRTQTRTPGCYRTPRRLISSLRE